ncbi:uncharacterized protein LOC126997825 [Eriocheir sinensis]|uniref:uncharacterized protein LOC126997825 n=1 Tax=Eriocheir sinensis TaxID=95602 RepID=UPI0021C956FC|nr:uncharacterized protein LOC126997825 [Eriocheir sinensis]
MTSKGFRGHLLSWVGQYLQGRTAAGCFQGTISAFKNFENGTPQGGIFSPLLFNLLVEKLVCLQASPQVQVLSYADDIAIVATGPNHVARARVMLRRLLTPCTDLGLIPNPVKTKAMAFGYVRPPDPLYINDTPVPWVHRFRYLGMLLDPRLTFFPYIASIRVKMSSRVNVIRAMAGRSCGAGDRVLRFFYTSAVRSCLDYAAPCLLTVPPSSLHPLETAPNSAIRTLLGAPLWAKCVCLRAKAFVCCVAERVVQLGVGHLPTLLRRAEAVPLAERVRQSLHQDPLLFQRQTWPSIVARTLGEHGLAHWLMAPTDLPAPAYTPPPPWRPCSVVVSLRPLPAKKSLLTPHELRREALGRIAGAVPSQAAVYYTDGSVHHLTGAVGAAFVCEGATALFHLSDGCSSTQAELVAISMALLHAEETVAGAVVVHSDSMSALQTIAHDRCIDNVRLLISI